MRKLIFTVMESVRTMPNSFFLFHHSSKSSYFLSIHFALLSLVLWELLEGKLPYEGMLEQQVIMQVSQNGKETELEKKRKEEKVN